MELHKEWNYKLIGCQFTSTPANGNSISCFDMNSDATTLFVVINKILYKADLTQVVNSGNLGVVKMAEDIGTPASLKVTPANEVLLTTDLQNGSLLKIDQNGGRQAIAANLGSAGVFDVRNNEYYIVIQGATGTVKKVGQNGSISDLITNVNFPSNICFDKNGNFVLQEKWTNDGATYERYRLYTPAGNLIEFLGDHANTLIVSGEPHLFTPLYIDQFNNLYFSHRVRANANGITNCNPNTNQAGIWKLQMNRR